MKEQSLNESRNVQNKFSRDSNKAKVKLQTKRKAKVQVK